MRLEQLQYVLEITRTKSMNIAAENLYITQPALSRAIRALEEELGVTLFKRTVEGTFLTKEGNALYADIQEILKKTERLYQHAQTLSNHTISSEPTIKLNILTFSTLVDTLFSSAVVILKQRYPHLSVTLSNFKIDSFYNKQELSIYDLVVLTDINNILHHVTEQSALYREELFSESYFAIMHKNHPSANKEMVTLQDLVPYKVIVPQNGLPVKELFRHLLPANLSFDIFMQSNNARVITAALCQQEAILLSTDALRKQNYLHQPELHSMPIRELQGNCFALYDPEHPYNAILRELLTILKTVH